MMMIAHLKVADLVEHRHGRRRGCLSASEANEGEDNEHESRAHGWEVGWRLRLRLRGCFEVGWLRVGERAEVLCSASSGLGNFQADLRSGGRSSPAHYMTIPSVLVPREGTCVTFIPLMCNGEASEREKEREREMDGIHPRDEPRLPDEPNRCSGSSSCWLLGMSFSDKNGAVSPPMRSTLCSRSMQHWCLRSMSRPRRKSMSMLSSTVIEHANRDSPMRIMAEWMRPMILLVPTPRAIPDERTSIRRLILRCQSCESRHDIDHERGAARQRWVVPASFGTLL